MIDRRERSDTRRIVQMLTDKIEQIAAKQDRDSALQRKKIRIVMSILALSLITAVGVAGALAGIVYQTNERAFYGQNNNALLCAVAKSRGIETVRPDVCGPFESWVKFNTNADAIKSEADKK